MKWCLRLFKLSLHFLFRFRFSNAIAMRITNKNTERKIPIRLFISNPLTEISMWLCWLHFELSLFATFSVLVTGGRIRKIFRTFCNHFRLSRQNFSLVIGPFPVVLLVLVFFRNFVCLWFVSTRFNFSIAQFKQVEKRTSIAFRTTTTRITNDQHLHSHMGSKWILSRHNCTKSAVFTKSHLNFRECRFIAVWL